DLVPRVRRSTPTTVIIKPYKKRSTSNFWLTLYYEQVQEENKQPSVIIFTFGNLNVICSFATQVW
ncbi:hypothetical protein, partial [Oceanobacillus luteolus]